MFPNLKSISMLELYFTPIIKSYSYAMPNKISMNLLECTFSINDSYIQTPLVSWKVQKKNGLTRL